jgi:hypothetical protein
METDMLNAIQSPKRRINAFAIFTFIVGVVSLALAILQGITLKLYINSGGLNAISGVIATFTGFAIPLPLIFAVIAVPIALIVIIFRRPTPLSLLISLTGFMLILASQLIFHFVRGNDEELVRYWAHNEMTAEYRKQLINSIDAYAQKHDGRIPPTNTWYQDLKQLEPNLPTYEKQGYLRKVYFYAFNANLANTKLSTVPSDVVVFFESKPVENLAGTQESLTTENHGGRGCVIIFGDMHVEFVKAENIKKLKWMP